MQTDLLTKTLPKMTGAAGRPQPPRVQSQSLCLQALTDLQAQAGRIAALIDAAEAFTVDAGLFETLKSNHARDTAAIGDLTDQARRQVTVGRERRAQAETARVLQSIRTFKESFDFTERMLTECAAEEKDKAG